MQYLLTKEELDKLQADKTGESEIQKRVNAKLEEFAKDYMGIIHSHREDSSPFSPYYSPLLQSLTSLIKKYRFHETLQ